MNMKKRYKLTPCSIYDVPATETWLSDLAQQGMHLRKTGRDIFSFQKGEKSDTKYRLEPIPKDWGCEPDDDMKEAYEQAGWEFVTVCSKSFFIWRSIRADAKELHSDPLVHSTAYEHLCARLFKSAVQNIILIFGFLAIFICGMLLSPQPVTLFLASPSFPLLIAFEFLCSIQAVRHTLSLHRLKHSLAEGLPAPHHKGYKKRLWLRRTFSICISALWLIIVSMPLFVFILNWNRTTSEIDIPLPYLPLDQLEQSEDFSWHKDTYIKDGADAFNHVSYSWTPLVPVHYDIYQQGEPQKVFTGTEPDAAAVQPSASTEYFQLLLPVFTVPLYKEQLKCLMHTDDNPVITKPQHPGFDHITISKSDEYTQLFACRGNQVIQIRYWGSADLSERLDELSFALDHALDYDK